VAVSVLPVFVASQAAPANTFVDELLRQERFSPADLRARDAGEAVVKSLDTPVRRELAHFGIVYIDAPADRFIDRFGDIERFERGPGVPQIGRFSVPPRLEDLASLTLPPKDVSALAACRPGDCDLKLSAAAMSSSRGCGTVSSPSASQQADAVARELILDLVREYQANGDGSLGSYDDGLEPLSVAEQFRALLTSGHPLPLPVPELMTYLGAYPHGRPAGAKDFFYWSVVDFGLRPTLRVNHAIVYSPAGRPSGVSHVIAIKQIYASHYFHATLELRFLVDAVRPPDRRGFYLLSISRSRIDGTGGMRGSLMRSVINRRSRNAVRRYLEHLKQQVESADPKHS
jgi:hypothetical protein